MHVNPSWERAAGRALPALAVVLAAAIGYAPALGHFFQPVDDPTLLWCAREGADPTPHARPLYTVWNAGLLALFGLRPLGWNLAGLCVHAVNALLVARLARWTAGSRVAGTTAGVAFALLYGPHEAVMWVAANCGLCSLLCVLLSGAAWCAFLDAPPGRRAAPYVAALLALAAATGFKEDSVLAGPLLLGLDLARNGRRALAPRRLAAVYAAPALIGAVYLSIAFRPSLWSELESVGRYRFDLALLPKLLRSFALCFWPRTSQPASAWIPPAIGLALALALPALVQGRARVLARLGVALALFGLLPALPGPFHLAGTRYVYPAAPGAAWMIAAGLDACWERWRARPARAALVLGLAGWACVQVLALRSVARWRFDVHGERMRAMIGTSEPVLLAAPAVVVAPAVRNAHDYLFALCVWHAVPRSAVAEGERLPFDDALRARFARGGDLDPARRAVFACGRDGRIFRVRPEDDLPFELWRESAATSLEAGRGRTLSTVRVGR